jgi:hypothetical protein
MPKYAQMTQTVVVLQRVRQKRPVHFIDEDNTYHICIPPSVDMDMGYPAEVTVTVMPGDHLSKDRTDV